MTSGELDPENEAGEEDIVLPPGSPPLPPLDSMLSLFGWYSKYLGNTGIRDCRGFQVIFREEDFIHLVKIIDRYGREPKNKAEAVRRIKAGELKMFHGSRKSPPNFSLQRAKELACALSAIRSPDMIVQNWQPMGRANPGEAYIRNFGKDGRRRFRVLICGIAGKKRLPVTMFPRQRFAEDEILIRLWP